MNDISAEKTTDVDRPIFERNRTEGHVIRCDGMNAIVSATANNEDGASEDYWSVGQLMSIVCGDVRVVGILFQVDSVDSEWAKDEKNHIHIHIELVGEVIDDANGKARFRGGLSVYPHLGAVAHRIRKADLAAIFENDDSNVISIGSLSQNSDIPALISIDGMISRHFAVVGTTGVGKSTSVSLLLRKVVQMRPDVRILILDPHNEFATAMPDIAETIDDGDLVLPFWLFTLEELTEVLFSGRKPVPAEVDLLRDLIPQAKAMYASGSLESIRRSRPDNSLTADTPVPYRMADLHAIIDERLGKLDSKAERMDLRSLMNRLKSLGNDARFDFMLGNRAIGDNLQAVITNIFRVNDMEKPVSALQLSGIPSEVVNAVVSVLCRLAFDLAVVSKGRVRTLVVCEEAHRYIPADREAGFAPTRAAIGRIAKEGRKYGVHLAIITQRPGELDETILSQCNTFFAMRLSNERDQEIMRKAISGGSRSFVNFIPSLANREAIAFGQGASTPMRMKFETVPAALIPGQERSEEAFDAAANVAPVDVGAIIRDMRAANGVQKNNSVDDLAGEIEDLAPVAAQRESSDSLRRPNYDQPTGGRFQTAPSRDEFSHSSRLSREAPSEPARTAGPTVIARPSPKPAMPEPITRKPDDGAGSSLINRFRRG